MKDVGEERGPHALRRPFRRACIDATIHLPGDEPSGTCIALHGGRRRHAGAGGGPCCWTRENGRVFFFLSGNRTDCMAAVLPPAAAAQTVLTDGWTCSTERRTVWYGMPAGLAWLNTAPIPSSLLKDKQWHTR
jgi:hypothetical protein